MTAQQTMEHAQSVIHKDRLRQFKNELKPYSDLSGSARGKEGTPERDESGQRLRFEDGKVVLEGGLDGGNTSMGGKGGSSRRSKLTLTPSKKRRNEGMEEEGDETETSDIEADQEEEQEIHMPGLAGASSSTADDFPPVFTSPRITQPELFSGPVGAVRFGKTIGEKGREVKGMPGRGGRSLGKTVSAPVGGLWSSSGGMDVDEGGQDGFDISEWAGSENF
jgi:hypothetical protein